jgi:hypothetical protein
MSSEKTMDDIRQMLRNVETVMAPDLWGSIRQRATDGPETTPDDTITPFGRTAADPRRRVGVILTAAAVFALGSVLVWQGFRPASVDETSLPAGTPEPLTRCDNEVEGYSIAYPRQLFTTNLFNGEADARHACRWFDTRPFDPTRGNDVLDGFAYPLELGVRHGALAVVVRDETTGGVRVLEEEATSVDGQPAVRIELELVDGLMAPRGTRLYEYVVELSSDRTLRIFTADQPGIAGTYAQNKVLVDLAVDHLQVGT